MKNNVTVDTIIIRYGYNACRKNLLTSLFHYLFHYDFTDFNTEKRIDSRGGNKKKVFFNQ